MNEVHKLFCNKIPFFLWFYLISRLEIAAMVSIVYRSYRHSITGIDINNAPAKITVTLHSADGNTEDVVSDIDIFARGIINRGIIHRFFLSIGTVIVNYTIGTYKRIAHFFGYSC